MVGAAPSKPQSQQRREWSCSAAGRLRSRWVPAPRGQRSRNDRSGPRSANRPRSESRGGSQPSPQGLPAHAASGQRASWGSPGSGQGLRPAGLRAPAKAASWLSLALQPGGWTPPSRLYHLPVAAACVGRGLRERAPSLGGPRSPKASGALGAWVPQRGQLGRAWGPGAKELPARDLSPPRAASGPQRVQAVRWSLALVTENHVCLVEIYRNLFM